MLDGVALRQIIDRHQPDFIVPEIEAIRTEKLFEFENEGITVVPSAKAVNFTMDRKAIRDLAANFRYATNADELIAAVEIIGIPCVVKPLMSSSGKGQSTIRTQEDIANAWKANEGARGDKMEVVVEEFIPFKSEITLLTVTQENGPTLFCLECLHLM